ncbi:MAG: oxygen-dependent coproporphyrinogen oxidase [Flavobacteriales bacterium]
MSKSFSKQDVANAFKVIQDSICSGLEECDGQAKFITDEWNHETGGGGRSRVIQQGNVFEKGGVNFSAVEGKLPDFMKYHTKPESTEFFATGVSIVIHPSSPMVPIIHMNIRYFETNVGDVWFGGGIDLTPIYVNRNQASQFHRTLKETCDQFDSSYYPQFKAEADDYFFIKHRNETRGIGGIFYDYLMPGENHSADHLFEFSQAVGNTFLKAYLPIANANKALSFTEEHKNWQLLRRGRYVEFNLVYDRGTKFGLETGGRTESILMSLPEHVSWLYNHKPVDGSAEEQTLLLLKKGINWIE